MKKLAIVGTHPDTRGNAPFDDASYDIWVFNEAPQAEWCKRWSACFQLHKPEVYTSPNNMVDATHWDWLQKDHGDKTIWMQEADPRVPNATKYPLEAIQRTPYCVLTSTVSMALALALYLEYEYIEIHGVDLSSNTEYQYQQNGWMFWVGRAVEKLSANFVLRSGLHHFQKRVYGYEGEIQIDRAYFAERAEFWQNEKQNEEKRLNKIKADLQSALDEGRHDDYGALIVDVQNAAQEYGIAVGALQEATNYAKRDDPIARQQFERRGAQAQEDGPKASQVMYKESGIVEYMWNVWKATSGDDAKSQLKMFADRMIQSAFTTGGNLGVWRENASYMLEYDNLAQAAGGSRTIEALVGAYE